MKGSSGGQTAVLAAAAAGAVYLATRPPSKPRKPNSSTGAPTNNGSPSAPIGGVADYIGIHMAMRVAAFDRGGIMPDRGPDGMPVPVTTRSYALLSVVAYWQRELNRLVGLAGNESLLFARDTPPLSLSNHPTGLPVVARIIRHGSNHLVKNTDSIAELLKAWDRFVVKVKAHVLDGAPFITPTAGTLDQEDAGRFWEAVVKFAIAMDVDRAVPDVGGVFVFLGYVGKSIVELPERVAEAARDVAEATGGLALSVVLAVVKGFVFSPIGLAVVAGAAFVYRAELGAAWKVVSR